MPIDKTQITNDLNKGGEFVKKCLEVKDFIAFSLILLGGVIITIGFSDGLVRMTAKWNKEEYSHAVIIPFISLFLVLKKLPLLSINTPRHQWLGLFIMAFSYLLWLAGELSSIFMLVEYAYLVAITGLIVSFIGVNGTRIIWVALVYLLFMIPLPNFLYNNLSSELQLISSELGVMVVRAFGISVFLEGNVIDLGAMQLQVVEACSGLHYLFPLMSFGFLVTALMHGPFWHKAVLFLSTLPITVLMNSFRIGVIGISVEYFGIEAAQGFLHDFEGWVVFMACLALLFAELLLLHKLSGSKDTVWDRIDLSLPEPIMSARYLKAAGRVNTPALLTLTSIMVMALASNTINEREELTPERKLFASIPLIKDAWLGREGSIDSEILDTLKTSDYIIADYATLDSNHPVNLYVAYYESQRKGASIHSPRSCMPGGGWMIKQHTIKTIEELPQSSVGELTVNQVIIEKDSAKLLVYYWFQQRGKIITNEYLAKWHLFWDALTMNRSDGALVRITTHMSEHTTIEQAEQRLLEFLIDFQPVLNDYIPN